MSTVIRYPRRMLGAFCRDKDLPVPDIVIVDGPFYTGAAAAYIKPDQNEISFDGRPMKNRNGILAVAGAECNNYLTFESSLAHEYRHHWQRFNSPLYYDYPVVDDSASYKEGMIQYFSTSLCEMDALLFECKHAPSDCNLERYEWLENSLARLPRNAVKYFNQLVRK